MKKILLQKLVWIIRRSIFESISVFIVTMANVARPQFIMVMIAIQMVTMVTVNMETVTMTKFAVNMLPNVYLSNGFR